MGRFAVEMSSKITKALRFSKPRLIFEYLLPDGLPRLKVSCPELAGSWRRFPRISRISTPKSLVDIRKFGGKALGRHDQTSKTS